MFHKVTLYAALFNITIKHQQSTNERKFEERIMIL